MRTWTMAALGAFALYAAGPAYAGSVTSGTLAVLKPANTTTRLVEEVAYRRCWWRKGTRHCRRYRSAYYPYYGGYGFRYSGPSIGIILGVQ
jgi:hypothetical protein